MKKRLPLEKACADPARPVFACVLGLSCLLISISFTSMAQSQLIKDIEQREEVLDNEYRLLTDGSSVVYYASWGDLWKSGGSTATTVKLKSFRRIDAILTAGSTAYFAADDGTGMELWKTNGTVAGTVRVKDIHPNGGSNPQQLTNVNGTVYFTADNGKNGRELWKTNGTAAGTLMVKDILQVSGSSTPTGLTEFNGQVFFSANNGSHGYELWKSNGTAEGTQMVKDIRPEVKVSSAPQLLTRSNGMLFFAATDAAGRELWKTDGTAAGTVRVKDIRASGNSDIENLTDVNGTLFFTANDGIHGDELWKSDGTEAGTVLVKDMNPGSAGSNGTAWFTGTDMNSFSNINGMLFFIASQGYNEYICRSDGTADGTVRIASSWGTGLNYSQPEFTYMQNHVYFLNVEGESEFGQLYLWKMPFDGTTPMKVRAFYTPLDYSDEFYYENYEHSMIESNGALYIAGRITDDQGFKLIRSDGTAAGTTVVFDSYITTLGSNPAEMTSVNGFVFFRTMPDPHNYLWPSPGDYYSESLYRTDGTAAGTYRLPGAFQDWNDMEVVGNSLYYTVEINGGWELNRTDGHTITNVQSGTTGEGRPIHLTAVGNLLYYANGHGQVWKSDGTGAGTTMIKDLTWINSINAVNGRPYVLVKTSSGGLEMWRTNDTGALIKVKTIRTSDARPSMHYPTATNGKTLYFVANDGIHGNEVWQSDGTTTGTFMLFDVNQNDPFSYSAGEYDIETMAFANGHLFFGGMAYTNDWALFVYSVATKELNLYGHRPVRLTAHNDKVFFVSETGLFSHDGTQELSTLLVDFGFYPDKVAFATINHELYASVSDHGRMVWRTDGTECGTVAINTGVGRPYPIAAAGDDMIFGGESSGGVEPHVYRNISAAGTRCLMTVSAEKADEVIITPYPNPFTTSFTLHVNGTDDEIVEVGVYSPSGLPVQKLEGLKPNTSYYDIGNGWARGMYIVKVNKGGKLSSYTIIKK